MLLIISSWIMLLAAFSGIGLLVFRLWKKRLSEPEDIGLAFWIGWACVLAFLLGWHLFLPVTPILLIGFAAAGAAGWVLSRQAMAAMRSWLSLRSGIVMMLWLAMAVLISTRAMDRIDTGDTGEYHLPQVSWANAYPAIPGLGNLHPRYAYNQSTLLVNAILNAGPFEENTQQLPNGLLLWVAIGQSLAAFARLVSRENRRKVSGLFGAMMLAPLLDQVNQKGFSSLSADPAVFVMGLAAFLLLLQIVLDEEQGDAPVRAGALTLLLIAGVTVKTSFMGLALAACIVLAVAVFRGYRSGWSFDRKAVFVTGGIGLAAIAAWLVRGYLLSGYAVFPSTLLRIPVDWAVPESEVMAEAEWVMLRARNFAVPVEEIVRGSGWFAQWYALLPATILKPMEVAIASAVAAALFFRKQVLPAAQKYLLLLAVPAAAIAFWFLLAPAPRFAGAAVWMLVCVLILLVLDMLPLSEGGRAAMYPLAGWLFLAWAVTFISLPRQVSASKILIPPDRSIHPEYSVKALFDGTNINLPVEDECWQVPQPCTNHLLEGLSLRTTGIIKDGFRIAPVDSLP